MPIVLVHGVPETPEVWDPLRAALDRTDVIAAQLPGFGCDRPAGFSATKEAYLDWLIAELEAASADGPVDLVGHDWGGGLTVRLVSVRPDLVRSWVTDCAGMGSSDFEWHDFAKLWQTPEAGEQFFEQQLATPPNERGAVYEMLGVPADDARRMGSWSDSTMASCILGLYRSAVDVAAEWAPEFVDIAAPGLVVIPSDDPFLSASCAGGAAARAGARVAHLDGVGHWWMLQAPRRAADMLQAFWSSID